LRARRAHAQRLVYVFLCHSTLLLTTSPPHQQLLYNALLDALCAVFVVGDEQASLVATFSWFFFDVVCKSITLQLHRTKKVSVVRSVSLLH
jgi:hypothetical protein